MPSNHKFPYDQKVLKSQFLVLFFWLKYYFLISLFIINPDLIIYIWMTSIVNLVWRAIPTKHFDDQIPD